MSVRNRKALLSFVRLPVEKIVRLNEGIQSLGYEVAGVASHSNQELSLEAIFPNALRYVWGRDCFHRPWAAKLDVGLYEEVLGSYRADCLPLNERFMPYQGGSMEQDLRLSVDFSVAHEMVEKIKPDVILLVKIPESAFEVCLYLLAKHFGIDILFTSTGLFSHSRFATREIFGPAINKDKSVASKIVPICNIDLAEGELSRLARDYLSRYKRDEGNMVPYYMRFAGIDASNSGERNKPNFRLNFIRRLLTIHKYGVGSRFQYGLLKHSERLATPMEKIDWNGVTIYFALHYQPECTTMPLGGRYVNQLKAIKVLSDQLGNRGTILVKDHPLTFSSHTSTNINFRYPSFYNRLASFPNVEYVSVSANSAYLQSRSSGVATIGSMAGFENLLRGKTTIIFGNPSYRNAPGCIRADSVEEIELAIQRMKSGISGESAELEMREFILAFDRVCHHADEVPANSDTLSWNHNRYIESLLAGLENR